MSQHQDSATMIATKAAPGLIAWLGGFTLDDFSHLMSGLSYAAGFVYFVMQAYFLWRDKHRADKG